MRKARLGEVKELAGEVTKPVSLSQHWNRGSPVPSTGPACTTECCPSAGKVVAHFLRALELSLPCTDIL